MNHLAILIFSAAMLFLFACTKEGDDCPADQTYDLEQVHSSLLGEWDNYEALRDNVVDTFSIFKRKTVVFHPDSTMTHITPAISSGPDIVVNCKFTIREFNCGPKIECWEPDIYPSFGYLTGNMKIYNADTIVVHGFSNLCIEDPFALQSGDPLDCRFNILVRK